MTSAALEHLGMRSGPIIRAVLDEYILHSDDFFGDSRDAHIVEARRDAARRLKASGFAISQMTQILRRDRATVLNYFPQGEERRKARYAFRKANRHMPEVTCAHDGVIAALWKQGLDTAEIARHAGLHEHQVYNRLPAIRGLA